LLLNVSDDGYSRNASCALYQISTFSRYTKWNYSNCYSYNNVVLSIDYANIEARMEDIVQDPMIYIYQYINDFLINHYGYVM
jgi:hypothetical protein